MTTRHVDCGVKWCHEVGEHAVHRLYLTSLPAWTGAWVIGINVAQTRYRPLSVELTVCTKQGIASIIPLLAGEAESIGHALVEAAERVLR